MRVYPVLHDIQDGPYDGLHTQEVSLVQELHLLAHVFRPFLGYLLQHVHHGVQVVLHDEYGRPLPVQHVLERHDYAVAYNDRNARGGHRLQQDHLAHVLAAEHEAEGALSEYMRVRVLVLVGDVTAPGVAVILAHVQDEDVRVMGLQVLKLVKEVGVYAELR